MNPAQSTAGHQARSQPGISDEARRGWTSGRLGAGLAVQQVAVGLAAGLTVGIIAATIQAVTTMRRCRIVQRAMFDIFCPGFHG